MVGLALVGWLFSSYGMGRIFAVLERAGAGHAHRAFGTFDSNLG